MSSFFPLPYMPLFLLSFSVVGACGVKEKGHRRVLSVEGLPCSGRVPSVLGSVEPCGKETWKW